MTSTVGPSVLALLDPFVKGWPEHDIPEGEDPPCGVFPLADVLRGRYDTDVHFTAYWSAIERRHTAGSIATPELSYRAGVTIVAAVFDVDGPEHWGSDEWWAKEKSKLEPLFPHGAFVYRTRGGYRIVFILSKPFDIAEAADGERWSREYLGWCAYLEEHYAIKADRRCKEWQRLYRAPHATRDGVLLDLETIGDPENIGRWSRLWSISEAAPAPTPPPAGSATSSASRPRTAAVAMLGAAWPSEGRHGAQLALAGALCRDGWPEADAVDFLCGVCRTAGNEDRPKREKTVRDTYKAHAQGRHIQGWTALEAHVGAPVVAGARATLDPNAAGFAEFSALLAPKAAAAPAAGADDTTDTTDELGIQWGGWDAIQSPPKYLLEGLIPEAKVVTFFAEGGSLKTWAALSLAISVGTGEPWLGTHPVRKGRALVLDYEDGGYEFHRRVRYLTGGRDIPDLGYRYGGPQIDSLDFWMGLTEHVQKRGITLVIFDSISASMPGDADENSSAFAQGVKYAGRFTECGCTVVFIHHANKSGGMRGHGAVRDQSDVVFRFAPVSETDDSKRMRMECDKPGPQKKPLPVNVELTDAGLFPFTDEVEEISRNATTEAGIEAAIRLALGHGPAATVEHLRTSTGKKRNTLAAALKTMVQTGEVVKLGKGGYALDDDDQRTFRVLEQLGSGKAFATVAEVARHSFVDPLFVDALRLKGVICQSADGRWMRVNK